LELIEKMSPHGVAGAELVPTVKPEPTAKFALLWNVAVDRKVVDETCVVSVEIVNPFPVPVIADTASVVLNVAELANVSARENPLMSPL
jgi:hypothetical protein